MARAHERSQDDDDFDLLFKDIIRFVCSVCDTTSISSQVCHSRRLSLRMRLLRRRHSGCHGWHHCRYLARPYPKKPPSDCLRFLTTFRCLAWTRHGWCNSEHAVLALVGRPPKMLKVCVNANTGTGSSISSSFSTPPSFRWLSSSSKRLGITRKSSIQCPSQKTPPAQAQESGRKTSSQRRSSTSSAKPSSCRRSSS